MEQKYSRSFDNLPDSMKKIVQLIVDKLKPKKVLLFGSRARGTHRPNSDFDICVVGAAKGDVRAEVSLAIDEEPITLFKVDLLFYENLTEDYLKNIKKDGVEIYG